MAVSNYFRIRICGMYLNYFQTNWIFIPTTTGCRFLILIFCTNCAVVFAVKCLYCRVFSLYLQHFGSTKNSLKMCYINKTWFDLIWFLSKQKYLCFYNEDVVVSGFKTLDINDEGSHVEMCSRPSLTSIWS